MNMFDLSGRLGLVTGSSRGIGYALAQGLLQAGARVVIHGRDVKQATLAATTLADETGGQTRVSTFDVTDLAAVDRGIADIEADWGTPDILVNNAGLQRRKPFIEFSLEDWNDLVATNLRSAFLVGQRVARGMVARGSGKIILYGILMLTKVCVPTWGPSGVQTNALAPGYFETELTRSLVEDEEFSAWVRGRTPAGRWGKVEDLIGALVFLASPASDFVNGQVLFVDGGMTAVV
jgi:gluconate 5-dehydrogenase